MKKLLLSLSGFRPQSNNLKIFFASIVFLLAMNSCQKTAEKRVEKQEFNLAEFQKSFGERPQTQILVNEKLQNWYEDEKGNKVTPDRTVLQSAGPGCYPNVEPEATLVSWAAISSCASTKQVYGKFTISSQNAIVGSNPNNVNQKTRGRVIITQTSNGSSVYTNNNILPVTITALGLDPVDATHTIYQLEFNLQNVPNSFFAGTNTIRLGLYYYTECEEESLYVKTTVSNQYNTGGLTTCNSVHNIGVAGSSSYYSLNGWGACLNCCQQEHAPDWHEVEYYTNPAMTPSFKVGNSVFLNYYEQMNHDNDPSYYTPTSTITLGSIRRQLNGGIANGPIVLTAGTTYYIRFRNSTTNNITTGCKGPWIQPTVTIVW